MSSVSLRRFDVASMNNEHVALCILLVILTLKMTAVRFQLSSVREESHMEGGLHLCVCV